MRHNEVRSFNRNAYLVYGELTIKEGYDERAKV